MASSGLPSGAFLTTIEGQRCTAVPRVAAVSASANSVTSVATATTSSTSSTRTTAAATTTTTNPATGLAAAPAAEIDTASTAAEQRSTSTTSSSLAITTSTPPPAPVRIAQAQDGQLGSSAPPLTPLPAALSPVPGATLQSFTAFADVPSSQTSVIQSSQADASVTAPAVDVLASSSDPALVETGSPDLPVGPAATPLLTTIELPQTPTGSVVADAPGTTSADPALTAIPTLNNNAVQSTVAVAGGVIGGVVAISVLAFFIWWWRRRLLRRRRSTLLTPLDAVPSFDRDEKGGYVITRGSIGPTPVTEKVKAALGQNFRRIRGHIRNKTAPSVNLDRGTSQFINMASTHSRANSGIIGADPTAKDRLKGWWSGMKFNRQRSKSAQEKSTPVTRERKPAVNSQPDFLTLLNMDDRELDREAQRRRASLSRLNGSVSSTDNFLGGLSLNFSGDNPFSDANAIAHTSAKPAPLAVNSNSNPFSDTNAIRDPPPALPKPATYVADIRRSRSNSTAAAAGFRQPSTVYNFNNRDSAGSLATLATATTANQRNKFRSDPFDLERPELLGGGNRPNLPAPQAQAQQQQPAQPPPAPSTAAAAAAGAAAADPKYPPRAAQQQQQQQRPRADSFTSRYSKYSKYSSGVSVVSALSVVESLGGDWSDPGPDVGPGSAGGGGGGRVGGASGPSGPGTGTGTGSGRWVPARERLAREREREEREREERERRQQQQGTGRRVSGGSLGSVGKAM